MKIYIDISVLTNQLTGVGWTVWEQLRELIGSVKNEKIILVSPFYCNYKNRILIETLVQLNDNVQWYKSFPLRSYFLHRRWRFIPVAGLNRMVKDADIVYYPNYSKPFPAQAKPNLVFIHDVIFMRYADFYEPNYREFIITETRKSLDDASCVIVNSQCTQKDLALYFNFPVAKTKIIPLGVSHKYFEPVSNELSKKILRKYNLANKKYFLYIGTIEPRKNIIGLLDSFSMFSENKEPRYELVLIGKKGWGSDAIFSYYETLKFKNHIHFLGYVTEEEKFHLLANAKVFVFPSFYEGFGLPVLEAMACGVPVITSDRASLPDVCGDAAILINPGDVSEICQAFYRITNDVSCCENLIEQGKKRARTYTWQTHAKELMKTMNQVLLEKC